MLTSVGESLYLTNHDPEIAMILKAVFVDWIRYSSIFFREIKCSDEREKERKLLSVNSFKVNNWLISQNLELITFSRALSLSYQKVLNSLHKCYKFVGGFLARHESFKSLIR